MSRIAQLAAVAAIFGIAAAALAERDEIDAHANADRALAAGIDWLACQQADDGGWHSKTYGQMRGGVGNTALAVYAIMNAPAEFRAPHKAATDRAFDFLGRELRSSHTLDRVDFPNYALALTILALREGTNDDLRAFRQDLQRRLLTAQQSDGGWGNLADDPSNISVTRFALEALGNSHDFNPAAKRAALAFVESCQNFSTPDDGDGGDGGFTFLPDAANPLNKAGWEAGDAHTNARSYGTATADGVLALCACGVPDSNPRIVAASSWLVRHRAVNLVPGFKAAASDVPSTRDGLQFYYLAALARVASLPGSPLADRRDAIRGRLIALQRADGSWQNVNTLMKEDDPLIATSLAVTALAMLADEIPPADRDLTPPQHP